MLLLQSVKFVPDDHVAVSQITGFVSNDVLKPGAHFKTPITTITLFTTKSQKFITSFDVLSKEGLKVNFQIEVTHKVIPQNVVTLHKQIGPDFVDKVIKPEVETVVRKVISSYSIKELEEMEQSTMSSLLSDELNQTLNDDLIQTFNLEEKMLEFTIDLQGYHFR